MDCCTNENNEHVYTACLCIMLLSENMALLFIFTSCSNMISLGRETEEKEWGLQLQLMEMWESTGYVERRKRSNIETMTEWWKSASVLPEMAVRKASDGTWKRRREKKKSCVRVQRNLATKLLSLCQHLASCLEVCTVANMSSIMLTIMVKKWIYL